MVVSDKLSSQIYKPVRVWLFIGIVLVFFQVLIGGITRLTDSGLSITEWKIIQGTLPPLNEVQWQDAFDKYQVAAKKQYESLHLDMSMSEFKMIYFWEYFHRLWARLMGFIFLFPFLYFLWKKWIPSWLLRRLGIVIFLAALAAVFGWIMVASGLNDDTRTWVSAYKLVIHLAIASLLIGYLFWVWLMARQPDTFDSELTYLKKMSWWITALLFLQILFGGLMAGMRAGLIHPHWPFFIEGSRLYSAFSLQGVGASNFIDYEPSLYIKAIVQVFHRGVAYLLSLLIVIFIIITPRNLISNKLRRGNVQLLLMLIVQFILGVFTVINNVGKVPVFWGVVHQAFALVLFMIMLYVNYQFKAQK